VPELGVEKRPAAVDGGSRRGSSFSSELRPGKKEWAAWGALWWSREWVRRDVPQRQGCGVELDAASNGAPRRPSLARTGPPGTLNTWRFSLRGFDSRRGRGPDRGQQRHTRRGECGQCGRAGARVPGCDTRRRGLPRSSARVSASGRRVASGDAASGSAATLGARAGGPDAKVSTARAAAALARAAFQRRSTRFTPV
jgi:hypothetical protein